MSENLFEHEDICLYRQVNCALYGCQEEVGFLAYLDHFKEKHSSFCNRASGELKSGFKLSHHLKFSKILPTTEFFNFEPKTFSAFDRTFFGITVVRNGILLNWIYILEDPTQAEHFVIEAKIMDGNSKSMTFEVGVNSMNLSHDKIIEDEINVFLFSVKTALKYAPGSLEILVKIRNLKEEAKDEDQESGISDND